MSDKLYKTLCETFPPIGSCKAPRITLYPPDSGGTWIERIYLNLIEKEFLKIEQPIVKSKEIKELAGRIFEDIEFNFFKHQEEGNVISFIPDGIDSYSQNYIGHYISVRDPLRYPIITISTGNRGSIRLYPRQRKKYFQFVKELYGLFLGKIKT